MNPQAATAAAFLGRVLHPAGPGPPTRPWCQLCEEVMAAEITLRNAPWESVKKLVEEMTLLIIDCYCMYSVWFCAEYLLHYLGTIKIISFVLGHIFPLPESFWCGSGSSTGVRIWGSAVQDWYPNPQCGSVFGFLSSVRTWIRIHIGIRTRILI